MDQYLYKPFLMGWTSILTQLFWCELQGIPWVSTHCHIATEHPPYRFFSLTTAFIGDFQASHGADDPQLLSIAWFFAVLDWLFKTILSTYTLFGIVIAWLFHMLWVYVWVPLNCFWHFLTIYDLPGILRSLFSHRQRPQVMPTMQRSRRPEKRPVAFGTTVDFSRSEQTTQLPWRIHGAAIYGVPWIPSIYPSHVSMYTSTMDPL